MQSSLEARHFSQIILTLDELAQRQRTARKLLVCSYAAEGRELLRALALAERGWIGFEPTDPKKLAGELVAHDLARDAVRTADAFDLLAILDQAIDDVLARGAGSFANDVQELGEQVGFRAAIRRSIEALRLEGIDAPALRSVTFDDLRKRNMLADVYAAYEQRLKQARLADAAEMYRRAVHGLSRASIQLPQAVIVLMPGLATHGLAGKFLAALRERGAVVAEPDAVIGLAHPRFMLLPAKPARAATALSYLNAPLRQFEVEADLDLQLDIFAAASPTLEIREVLRRAVASGLKWDEVEIVATDADVYGCALDSIARRLDIAVSYAIGLPAERTRPGRVVSAYLRWIQEDFREDILRGLLEAGDITVGGDYKNISGVALARRLRKLRVGWGRERYLTHIEAALHEAAATIDDEDSSEESTAARDEVRLELQALRALLTPILAATPSLPDRIRPRGRRVTPASLAEGLLTMLQHAVADHDVDRIARDRIRERLERVRATMLRELPFPSALTALHERLNVRVPAVGATGPAPWTASPGHIHLSNVEHGGYTARKATFIVGLDAGRFPGLSGIDPLLTDADRHQVSRGLTTSAERSAEAQYRLAALLARLRGSVTLSYSAYDAVEGRKLAPSAVVLQAHRVATRNPAATYDDLPHAQGALVTAVPHNNAALDGDDVWLHAMSQDGLLRASEHVVRVAFPRLDRGLAARMLRGDRKPGRHHGLISARAALDPRRNDDVVSASRLEALGTCALRYFYRYVLGIRPPDDAQFDPEVWLDPRNRGSLLHAVFERTLREARTRHIEVNSSLFERHAIDVLEQECARWRELVPPPSDAVFEREATDLRQDVKAFTDMCRRDGARWVALELKFGRDERLPVRIPLENGAVKLQGAIDRVDQLEDGRLLVIDYKTGSTSQYRATSFDAGRRLQHYLYSIAAAQLLEREVAGMEYRFPTRRAESQAAPYELALLASGKELIGLLLDNVAAGRFLPTMRREDCTYCDFRRCCRVQADRWGNINSPLANWASLHGQTDKEYAPLVQLSQRFK